MRVDTLLLLHSVVFLKQRVCGRFKDGRPLQAGKTYPWRTACHRWRRYCREKVDVGRVVTTYDEYESEDLLVCESATLDEHSAVERASSLPKFKNTTYCRVEEFSSVLR